MRFIRIKTFMIIRGHGYTFSEALFAALFANRQRLEDIFEMAIEKTIREAKKLE